jgi:transposase-like protein
LRPTGKINKEGKGGKKMKGKTPRKYSTEFKLKLVKEYLETDKSYREMGIKYNMDFSVISDWVNKYKVYKDKAFKTNQRRRYSFIADESKIPAFLREELELDKKDEYGDAVKELKEEIERLKSKLVERDLKIRMLNEVSKKKKNQEKR